MTEQGAGAAEGTAGSEPRRRATWLRVVSGGVVALALAVAGIFALRAEGRPVHDVALTDGSVWVSGGTTGYWGRVNTGAHSLDLILHGAGEKDAEDLRPDILQDGRNAVGITGDRRLVAVDSRTGEPLEGEVQLPQPHYPSGTPFERPDLVALQGNTIAAVDHDTGRIWAKRLDPKGGTPITDLLETGLVDTVGPGAAITVSVDGDIMAVSAESGTVVEIPAKGEGFGPPRRADAGFSGSRAADITAVGDTWVILDLETGRIHAEGLPEPQSLPDGTQETPGVTLSLALLQQAGPEADVVAYQTIDDAGLVPIRDDLDQVPQDQVVSGIDQKRTRDRFQKISRPAINGDCLYAAWGDRSTIRWGRSCGGRAEGTSALELVGNTTRREGVVFRTNRGQILLNDLDTGRVFDIALTGDVRIDTWPGGAPRSEPERWISPVQRDRPTPPTTTSTTKTG
ncbi:hypothetical protein [Janibacter terrae]|uniref:hypothetical protein n=1 Tax=Janibacter terrae TaxID=103817 RepID=UPI00082D1074|nr:hypothetical protein [Janibacter terrae]